MKTNQLASQLCTQKDLESPVFKNWVKTFGENEKQLHRKLWEWAYISEALSERGYLNEGMEGLGFAVGTEPLTAAFCSKGSKILATDLYPELASKNGWVETAQHAASAEALNERGLCNNDKFSEKCRFKHVDMNFIPSNLEDFDFIWSSCALEHLGTLEKGEDFIYNAMACLKPGGVAVHTTEYNVSSNDDTLTSGAVCLYRKKDIERIVANLVSEGHSVDVDFTYGDLPMDSVIDVPPYSHDPHLKLQIGKYVVTSIGLIIQKSR